MRLDLAEALARRYGQADVLVLVPGGFDLDGLVFCRLGVSGQVCGPEEL